MNELKGTVTNPVKLPFEYGEYIDLVGGRTWSHFSSEVINRGENDRITQLNRFRVIMSGSNKYLGDQSHPEKLAQEILYLKLAALLDVFQIVYDYRLVAKSNFGDISDTSFRVGVLANKVVAPGLWTAQVAVEPRSSSFAKSNITQEQNLYRLSVEPTISDSSENHYALGILLLRTLIVNHKQNLAKVCQIIKKMRKQIFAIVKSTKPNDRRVAIEACFNVILNSPLLSVGNLYYKPMNNFSVTEINQNWRNLLLCGLRLIGHDIVDNRLDADDLSNDWTSFESNMGVMLSLKTEIKNALLNERADLSKDLHDIVYSLISDKKWLNASLNLLGQSELLQPCAIKSKQKSDAIKPTHHKHIDDIRSILKVSDSTNPEKKLELVPLDKNIESVQQINDCGQNILLNETLIQQPASFIGGTESDEG